MVPLFKVALVSDLDTDSKYPAARDFASEHIAIEVVTFRSLVLMDDIIAMKMRLGRTYIPSSMIDAQLRI